MLSALRESGGGAVLQHLDLQANSGISDTGAIALARAVWPGLISADLDMSPAARISWPATGINASSPAAITFIPDLSTASTHLPTLLALTELDLRACAGVTEVGARALASAIDAHNAAVMQGDTGGRRPMLVYRGPGSELLKFTQYTAAIASSSFSDDGDDDEQCDSDSDDACDPVQAEAQRARFEAMIVSENSRCGNASSASAIDQAELQYAQLLAAAAKALDMDECDEVVGGGSDDEK